MAKKICLECGTTFNGTEYDVFCPKHRNGSKSNFSTGLPEANLLTKIVNLGILMFFFGGFVLFCLGMAIAFLIL